MNKKLILWAITVSLGGFLFGLDSAVISGAEQSIKHLWNLDEIMEGWAVGIALLGTVFGAGFGGYAADKLGRKKALIFIGILFFISSVCSALAGNVNIFMFFRFIGGLSIGASSVVAPIYISEIAPPHHRGRLTISFQLNIVFGILIAYVSNYLFGTMNSDNDWRYMLAVVAIPALFFSVLVFFTPESPRWLIFHNNDEAGARKILAITEDDVDAAVNEIKNSVHEEGGHKTESLFTKKFSWLLILAFLLAFFNQLSGINAIIYYAPKIFSMTGADKSSALLSSVGIGVVNLIFTIIGWVLIDRYGRRLLMYLGSVGYIVSLALIGLCFYKESFANVPALIFVFIAAHAIGQGSVIWVFLSEIFPNTVRGAGMAFGCLTHWVFAAVITTVFPAVAAKFGATAIFFFFSGMMILQLLYVWRMMPETKGVSLEDLQKKLVKE